MIVCDTTEEGEALIELIQIVGVVTVDQEIPEWKREGIAASLHRLQAAIKAARLLYVPEAGRA